MVQLTSVKCYMMKTFGSRMKKYYNHRVPLKYKRFVAELDPEKIIEYHSRDDINEINPREGIRTYKDARTTMGRMNYLLPDLSDQDLEINNLYQQELDRQRAIVARITKIKVIVDSNPGQGTELIMNKDLSTPYDCSRHIHELVSSRSVVAELQPLEEAPVREESNETAAKTSADTKELMNVQQSKVKRVYWDMHRPLSGDCRIQFRHFTDKDLSEINKIYWRSCSFVLGMAIRLAFKDDIKVMLHSWPRPNIKSGSFIYDVALNLSEKWTPNEQELRAFTKVIWDIKSAAMPFERIHVSRDTARQLFANNPFKLSQIESIISSESSPGHVTVYRCGGLLDISVGPMISNTDQIGRVSLAAVHPFESESQEHNGVFYRFQGVSLPQQLPVSSYIYQNILLSQARKFNRASL